MDELGPLTRDADDSFSDGSYDSETDTASEGDDEEEKDLEKNEIGKTNSRTRINSTDDQLQYRLSLLNVGDGLINPAEFENLNLEDNSSLKIDCDGDVVEKKLDCDEDLVEINAKSEKSLENCDKSEAEAKEISEAIGGINETEKGNSEDEESDSSNDNADEKYSIRDGTSVATSTIDPRVRRSRLKYEKEKAKQKAKEKRIKRKGKSAINAKERRKNDATIKSYTSDAFF